MTTTGSRSAAERASSAKGPLFGMYALLTAALACVGAAAGGLFFAGDRTLVVPLAQTINRCALRFPVTGFLSAQEHALTQCRAAAFRTEGWFVLGAAGVVPVVTAGLVLVVPWLDRWRVVRAGRWRDVPGATSRFGLLCHQAGLTGRRCPDLWVAGLALRQAFTTALPGGRPLVVIPVKTALSHSDPGQFDPVLMHELAHVRARDVSWVSVVRGLALVTVPVLAVASVPAIVSGGNLIAERTFLIQAGAFVACSLLLAAALLRRREIDADRQAVRWLGSSTALDGIFGPAANLTRPGTRWPTPLARHPSLSARITALRDPLGARDSGFAYALAVGAITAMVINTSYFIAWTFDTSLAGLVPVRVSAGAGGLMLGLGLTPALLRHAQRSRDAGRPASWWQPAAGAALGLFVGSLVPPGTALGATISVFIGQGLAGVAIAGILALVGAGVVTLAAGLACLAAAPVRRVPAWVTLSVTTATVCCTAAVALLPVPSFNFSQPERLYLAFALPDDQWRWLAVLYPVAVVALAAMITPPRRQLRAVAAALVTPLLAATVTALLFFPHDHAAASAPAVTIERLGEEQWWAAVLAGLVVLIAQAVGRGVPGLARACVSGWLTTALVSVERAVYGSFTGGWHYFGHLPFLLTTPSVWLFYLGVLASCCALIRVRAPAGARRRWIVPAAACAGAAAVAVAVFSTGIPGLFVPLVPVASVRLPGSDLAHPARLTGTATPRGVLTAATARAILMRVGEALPGNWTSAGTGSGSAPGGRTTVTPAACAPFVYGQYLNVLSRRLTLVQEGFKVLPGFIDGAETLQVSIGSYARPVPAALFAAASRDVRACHRYTIRGPASSVQGTVRAVTMHGLPVPAWRADVSIAVGANSAALTWVVIGIGHNLVILSQSTELIGPLARPDDTVINAATRAVVGG